MSSDITEFSPEELFQLKENLAKIIVFGAWKKKDGWHYIRPEAGQSDSESRALVWYYEGDSGLDAGWHFRIGFCVVTLGGISSTEPAKTAEECMKHVDEILSSAKKVILSTYEAK